MANADIPRGLVPVRYKSGAPYNGAANVYYVPSSYGTALYVGDPVVTVTASSDANGVQTVALAAAAGTNTAVLGPIVSLAFFDESPVLRDSGRYHPASTAGYVMVADDPELLFEVQEDGDGGAMGTGAVGRNAQLVAGTGSTVTGWSGWELDSSTLATTATHQLRIVAPVLRADNDPTLTNAKWLVGINTSRHQMGGFLSGSGVGI
jgi:hypothetical protein